MIVKIKKLHPNAVTPNKTHVSDFCYDVTAVSKEKIAPNTYKYGLGIALQIEEEEELDGAVLSIDLRPRSSVWRTGLVLSNCTGTIDIGYTGEISAVFYHVIPELPEYNVGDRVGQIKIGLTTSMFFTEVEELEDTTRGDGGYGSTGN